ncbi:MAG: hypothetical protein ABS35_16120 [Kaistia sp. SCN 65-12]|nr:MAG: hypothetical protein ABS35_16120 [Kaistia sp. SCN 65-12]
MNAASLTGLPFLLWGLVTLDLWPTVFGITVIIGAKLWYIDRMAILYEDMIAREPHLRYQQPPLSYRRQARALSSARAQIRRRLPILP